MLVYTWVGRQAQSVTYLPEALGRLKVHDYEVEEKGAPRKKLAGKGLRRPEWGRRLKEGDS